ncbi:MAG TPA: hypothetical protein VI078_03915 [bacterium]
MKRIAVPALPALLLAAYALATVFRCRPVVFTANFWGEEGRCFAFATSHGWVDSLLQQASGYYSLWANLACTVAAKLVPLDGAPTVTMLFALVAQLATAAIVVTSEADFWRPPGRKLFGLAIILFAKAGKEVWLSTITSQFHFALAAVLILMEPDELPRGRRIALRALLLIGGLTGPPTSLLLPLYLWAFFRSRSRERAVQSMILLATGLVQGVSLMLAGDLANRSGETGLFTVTATVWTKIVWAFLGYDTARPWAGLLMTIAMWPEKTEADALAGLLLAAEALIVLFLFLSSSRNVRGILLGSCALFLVSSVLFSGGREKIGFIDPRVASRYQFLPEVTLLLMTLSAADTWRDRGRRVPAVIAVLLCASGLFHNIREYPELDFRYHHYYPVWTQEVSKWRIDPTYQPASWPAGWTVDLSGRPPD